MGAPTSLLQGARAFARDFPRDAMPKGYLWDIVDYVPLIIDAGLTGRGGWAWASDVADGDFETGILAPFVAGEQLLAQTTTGQVYRVEQNTGALTSVSTTTRARQNPVFLGDTAISPDTAGSQPPALWRSGGITVAGSLHKHAPVATVYKSMMVTGGAPGEEDTLRFSVPRRDLALTYDPVTDATNWKNLSSWDPNSSYATSSKITALAALRSAVLIFHAGSVERMRGTTPAYYPTGQGDMFIEPLFDRVGCTEPRSICYWNDNVVWADEHGVHISDGAVIRNLVSQGGILYFWRTLWGTRATVAACVFLDYYHVTIRTNSGPSVTLICDLNKRQWFRWQNVYALNYIASAGSVGMERVWGGMAGNARLARIGPCYFPIIGTGSLADGDGAPVMPQFETPWYRLGVESRKRVRFAYLSYDVRQSGGLAAYGGVGTFERETNGSAPAPLAGTDALEVGYIRSPQETSYTVIGTLPMTSSYRRYRLPVGQFPYGIAFKVRQVSPSSVNRIFDLAVESQAAERSRV